MPSLFKVNPAPLLIVTKPVPSEPALTALSVLLVIFTAPLNPLLLAFRVVVPVLVKVPAPAKLAVTVPPVPE